MEITGAESKARVPRTLPPSRGQVKIRVFKTIFKSVAALACCSGGSAPPKEGRDRPPVSCGGYDNSDSTVLDKRRSLTSDELRFRGGTFHLTDLEKS